MRGAQQPEPGPDADPVEVAREIALRRLAVRARTRAELAADLARRNVPRQAAAEVLDRFEEVGLVDDADFARMWVAGRPGVSSRRLREELRAKGVAAEAVEAAVAAVDHDDDLAAARAHAAKRLRTCGNLDQAVRDRRLAGALARRGFESGIVSQVLREVRSGAL